MSVRLAANRFVVDCGVVEEEIRAAHTAAAAKYIVAFKNNNIRQMKILNMKMKKYAVAMQKAKEAATAAIDILNVWKKKYIPRGLRRPHFLRSSTIKIAMHFPNQNFFSLAKEIFCSSLSAEVRRQPSFISKIRDILFQR